MGSIMGIVESPFFIGIVLFLGIVALARVLLSRDPTLKRSNANDRRRKSSMPTLPFYDSEGVLVTAERRACPDRRRSRLLEMQQSLDHS